MTSLAARARDLLTAEDDGRVCRDIPDAACHEQPRNFALHVASLGATKTGDGLVDPKLVLGWLLPALGAPTALVGLLVPLREAGSLLPQLVISGWIRRRARRKLVWAGGSLVQGLAVLGMAGAAVGLEGATAGWTILGLLAVFALARSFCSVAYKDVLGKTVSKATRGTATGTAATVASAAVLAFGALLAFGVIPLTPGSIAGALLVAAALWLAAAGLFTALAEEPGATEGGGRPIAVAREHLGLLRSDPQLRRFILVRGLLTATAIAPPYVLLLGAGGDEGPESDGTGLGTLGPAVLASALAGIGSTYVWGRLADRSSRRVLVRAAVAGAVALAAAAAVAAAEPGPRLAAWLVPALLLVLMTAYQGVRLGRSTHLVDMATADTRAAYTALSNTAIGVVLLGTGAFAALAGLAGAAVTLAALAAMCVLAAWIGRGLEEVQARAD